MEVAEVAEVAAAEMAGGGGRGGTSSSGVREEEETGLDDEEVTSDSVNCGREKRGKKRVAGDDKAIILIYTYI